MKPRMFTRWRALRRVAGEDYSGSSARGEMMKVGTRHGVSSARGVAYQWKRQPGAVGNESAADASGRPMGAYDRGDESQDLICMNSALADKSACFMRGEGANAGVADT